MFSQEVRLTTRYRFVIPKAIREALRINIGDEMYWRCVDNHTVIMSKTPFFDYNDEP